jgi:hypothetical protein
MTRIIAFTMLALFLGQATGVAEFIELDPCAQACPADSQEEHCPPDCQLCLCCATLRPAVVAEVAAMPMDPTSLPVLDDPEKDQLSPAPRDIFHIPKTLAS